MEHFPANACSNTRCHATNTVTYTWLGIRVARRCRLGRIGQTRSPGYLRGSSNETWRSVRVALGFGVLADVGPVGRACSSRRRRRSGTSPTNAKSCEPEGPQDLTSATLLASTRGCQARRDPTRAATKSRSRISSTDVAAAAKATIARRRGGWCSAAYSKAARAALVAPTRTSRVAERIITDATTTFGWITDPVDPTGRPEKNQGATFANDDHHTIAAEVITTIEIPTVTASRDSRRRAERESSRRLATAAAAVAHAHREATPRANQAPKAAV